MQFCFSDFYSYIHSATTCVGYSSSRCIAKQFQDLCVSPTTNTVPSYCQKVFDRSIFYWLTRWYVNKCIYFILVSVSEQTDQRYNLKSAKNVFSQGITWLFFINCQMFGICIVVHTYIGKYYCLTTAVRQFSYRVDIPNTKLYAKNVGTNTENEEKFYIVQTCIFLLESQNHGSGYLIHHSLKVSQYNTIIFCLPKELVSI